MANQFARYPSLAGKSVLITGGGSGIGATMVERFLLQGSRVAFLDLDQTESEKLVARLSTAGETAPVFVACDITDIAALRGSIASIEEMWGAIDVLVNNAARDDRHNWEQVTPEYWDAAMAVNLRHHFFAIQAVAPGMRTRGSGSIINMSSISWVIPSTGLPAYITAKAAIVGLTRTMAHELGAAGIRVNCILPGGILTERQRRLWWTPEYEQEILGNQCIKRILTPDDVTSMVLFLASEEGSAITNQSYVVDGGWV
jgi:D-xylose 1-dehydrogenase